MNILQCHNLVLEPMMRWFVFSFEVTRDELIGQLGTEDEFDYPLSFRDCLTVSYDSFSGVLSGSTQHVIRFEAKRVTWGSCCRIANTRIGIKYGVFVSTPILRVNKVENNSIHYLYRSIAHY